MLQVWVICIPAERFCEFMSRHSIRRCCEVIEKPLKSQRNWFARLVIFSRYFKSWLLPGQHVNRGIFHASNYSTYPTKYRSKVEGLEQRIHVARSALVPESDVSCFLPGVPTLRSNPALVRWTEEKSGGAIVTFRIYATEPHFRPCIPLYMP